MLLPTLAKQKFARGDFPILGAEKEVGNREGVSLR
jgi:hypothetical protein